MFMFWYTIEDRQPVASIVKFLLLYLVRDKRESKKLFGVIDLMSTKVYYYIYTFKFY